MSQSVFCYYSCFHQEAQALLDRIQALPHTEPEV